MARNAYAWRAIKLGRPIWRKYNYDLVIYFWGHCAVCFSHVRKYETGTSTCRSRTSYTTWQRLKWSVESSSQWAWASSSNHARLPSWFRQRNCRDDRVGRDRWDSTNDIHCTTNHLCIVQHSGWNERRCRCQTLRNRGRCDVAANLLHCSIRNRRCKNKQICTQQHMKTIKMDRYHHAVLGFYAYRTVQQHQWQLRWGPISYADTYPHLQVIRLPFTNLYSPNIAE